MYLVTSEHTAERARIVIQSTVILIQISLLILLKRERRLNILHFKEAATPSYRHRLRSFSFPYDEPSSSRNIAHSAADLAVVKRPQQTTSSTISLLGSVTDAMAKSKVRAISGPLDAKHVGGVNVTGSNTSSLDTYFPDTTLEPDELPSHTYVATGTTEVPRRSDTISNVMRRPSVSLKRSLSRLRTKSISHLPDLHRKYEGEHQSDMSITRTDSAKTARPLKMQSSMSRLRQRVGLDRDLYAPVPAPKPGTPEQEVVPEPIEKDYPPLRVRKSLARLTTASSIYPADAESELRRANTVLQRKSSTAERQRSSVQRRPSPPLKEPSATPPPRKQPPTRPQRTDSGTAIDFDGVPVQKRPVPFKEILAVQSFADRMALYKKTREYWAHADHGLTEWTERAGGVKWIAAQV